MSEERLQDLEREVRMLQRTIEIMACSIPGFGIVGLSVARRKASQQEARHEAEDPREVEDEERRADRDWPPVRGEDY